MTKKPTVCCNTTDGNAFGVMCAVQRAMRKAGHTQEDIEKYQQEATSGNYDHLIQTSMKYVDFE